jgi:mRNA interferase MazF
MEVRRGDLVLVSLPGAYGKPRPALAVQSDFFAEHPSLTVLPLTSALREAPYLRVAIQPTQANGLRVKSQVMIDKATTIPSVKAQTSIGRLEDETMSQVERLLALFLGIAK